MKKIVLGIVIFLCLPVLAIALWLFVYHLTGKEAWTTWKAERVSKGDHFEWAPLIPPDVPAEENFAMAPIVAGAIKGKDLDPRFKALENPGLVKTKGDWKVGKKEDLQVFADALGTKDLLAGFEKYSPALKELDLASRRPSSKLPINYSEGQIPSLLGFRGAIRTLRARALSELAVGKSEEALADVLTSLRIADHFKAEPQLISALLYSALESLTMQVVWEGLQDRRWNEVQLTTLQTELTKVDLLSSNRLAWEAERLFPVISFGNTAEDLPIPPGYSDTPQRTLRLGKLGKGWWYRNLLQMDRYYATCFLDVIDPKSQRVFPKNWISVPDWYNSFKYRKDLVMAQIALPALGDQVARAARIQSAIHQATIVCALERFRLANGQYPNGLGELSPSFIAQVPHDIVNGEPLRFTKSGNSFSLYSIGWDLQDSGGVVVLNSDAKPSQDVLKGDWAWVPNSAH